MSIIDKVNETSKSVSEKTKSFQELKNIKRKIEYEKARIYEIYTEIGQKYYESLKKGADATEEMKLLCDDIDSRRRRIKKMTFEENGIRGHKVCPKCNAEVNGKFKFCGVCGARIPDPDDDDFLDSIQSDGDSEG